MTSMTQTPGTNVDYLGLRTTLVRSMDETGHTLPEVAGAIGMDPAKLRRTLQPAQISRLSVTALCRICRALDLDPSEVLRASEA